MATFTLGTFGAGAVGAAAAHTASPATTPALCEAPAGDAMSEDTTAMAESTSAMAEEDAMAEGTSAMAEEDAMAEGTSAMAEDDAMADDSTAMAEEDAMSEEDAMAEDTSAMAEDDAMADDSTAMAEGDAMAEDSTAMAEGDSAMADSAALLDVAGEAGLTGFVAAVAATDLAETLAGEGPYTIFAASDDVFAAYLADTGTDAGDLLADTEALTTLLSGQIVEGELTIETLADGTCLTTLAGSGLLVAHDGDIVTVGGATVVEPDLHASNGVVHVVDQVLGG